jgi:MarR family 2-MHQ and catechol resistance regulon transcriptional repressor
MGVLDTNLEALAQILETAKVFNSLVSKGVQPHGLSKPQFDILGYVHFFGHQGPITLTELGKVMMVSKANITGIITRLEEKELLSRETQEADGRVKEISLTSKGKALVESVIPIYIKMIADAFSCLTEEKKDELCQLLGSLQTKMLQSIGEDSIAEGE